MNKLQLPGARHVVAVASGKGGVGKSTVATNLALALAADGNTVGLLDADIYGPSQGLMLGIAEGTKPEVTNNQLLPIIAYGVQCMSMSFLKDERTPAVWRGPMASGALQQLLTQTRWDEVDILVVDMPPGTGDIQLTLSQQVPLSGALVVTTPQDIALIDARKGIEMFRKVDVPVLGIVENMSTHVCTECGHEEAVFGSGGGDAIAREYGVDLLAQLPLSMDIRMLSDAGRPPVANEPDGDIANRFKLIARAVVDRVGTGPTGPAIRIVDD